MTKLSAEIYGPICCVIAVDCSGVMRRQAIAVSASHTALRVRSRRLAVAAAVSRTSACPRSFLPSRSAPPQSVMHRQADRDPCILHGAYSMHTGHPANARVRRILIGRSRTVAQCAAPYAGWRGMCMSSPEADTPPDDCRTHRAPRPKRAHTRRTAIRHRRHRAETPAEAGERRRVGTDLGAHILGHTGQLIPMHVLEARQRRAHRRCQPFKPCARPITRAPSTGQASMRLSAITLLAHHITQGTDAR